MKTRTAGALAVALCLIAQTATGQERGFPNRPIHMILPFTPGAAADIVARIVAEQMARQLQQPVVVENKAGAGGAVGAEAIAAAVPDGYTIGIAAMSTHVVNPSCNPHLRYDPIRSFTPIAMVADMPNILVARPGVAADFAGFREIARRRGEPANFGIPGNCTLGHVMLERLKQAVGDNLVNVPYRGSAASAADLLAGRLDFISDSAALLGPHIEAGKMTPLAVAWPKRLPALPDVPTYDELGLPSLNITIWYGIVGPAGLPGPIVAKYEEAVARSLDDAGLQARFDKAGVVPVQGSGSVRFGAFLRERYLSESRFIRERKMTSSD